MFHKEGAKIILISTALLVVVLFVSHNLLADNRWLEKTVQIAALIMLVLVLQFFRNPRRVTRPNNNHVISSVDGKVVVIEEVYEAEYFKDKRIQVSVFMSPINVHVTRYPVSGKVVYSKYHPGKYLLAWDPKSSTENERTTIVVDNPVFGPVLHRQIAGALAKRIVNYAQEGTQVIQGDDQGFIKFGSRVDIFLPLDAKIGVKLNQRARGGITVIATK
jgi:phosphatidylserine decarboxylase